MGKRRKIAKNRYYINYIYVNQIINLKLKMKKLKLLMLFMLTTLFSFSQNWKQIDTQSGILIEQSLQEYHDNQYDVHQEFHIFKFTNTTNSIIEFSYKIIINGQVYDTESQPTLTINPGESITGVANQQLSLFHRFLPNGSGIILSETKINGFTIQINLN